MASISVSLDRNADRHDVKLLKRELDTLPGVTSVSVSSGGQLAVDYDATGVRQADILEKIQALGKSRANGRTVHPEDTELHDATCQPQVSLTQPLPPPHWAQNTA